MKRTIIACAFVIASLSLFSQRIYLAGKVVDKLAGEDLADVSVRNISAGLLGTTNASGIFKIPGKPGDSVSLSYIGYQTITVVLSDSIFAEDELMFFLQPEVTYLEEVTITKFPEYADFKQEILQTNPDSEVFQPYGVPLVAIKPEDRLNASLKASGPFSALHKTFSKKAREQKKVKKLYAEKEHYDKAIKKFNRQWVSENTGLEGDLLTSFMAYCNFSYAFLAKSPEYLIYEDMMAKLPQFLVLQESNP